MTWISIGTFLFPTRATETGTPSLLRAEAEEGCFEEQPKEKIVNSASPTPPRRRRLALFGFVSDITCVSTGHNRFAEAEFRPLFIEGNFHGPQVAKLKRSMA
jgi:hypothetical protein